jgi:hypothetical protein
MAVSALGPHNQTLDNQILNEDQVPFRQLAASFDDALGQMRADELRVVVAGFRVHLRALGADLAGAMFGALRHLPTYATTHVADLRIDVWDASATGRRETVRCAERAGAGILLKASRDDRFVGETRNHTELWLDRCQNRIVGWFDCPARLNLDERARPFHKLLSTWLEERGVQFLHAGLVSCHGKGLLFVGNGGAGKSTSSIACLRSGMGYLGDDFVGFSCRGSEVVGHGIYGSCLLNVQHIKRFPDLAAIAHTAHHAFEDKDVVFLNEAFPGAMQSDVGIRALLLPRVIDSETTRTRAATKGEALMAIAPTSVMFLPRPSRAAFDRVAALVESLPCYWLELGRDVNQIPAVVRTLAETLSCNS